MLFSSDLPGSLSRAFILSLPPLISPVSQGKVQGWGFDLGWPTEAREKSKALSLASGQVDSADENLK